MKNNTFSELKQNNINNVCQYIYRVRSTSKQNISQQLGLSRPTVNQILLELEKRNLIEKNGYFSSTGGRKPEILTFCPNCKIALGIEILKESYEITAINLYGEILKSEKYMAGFKNIPEYFQKVCLSVLTFADTFSKIYGDILGVGIVLQGLISSDGTCVTYGKILNCTGLHVSSFQEYLPWPCKMIHDAESAANIELWENPDVSDAIFFHIRSTMSGALIVNSSFLPGKELKSGVFEHMTLIPDGRPCYCGKNGCVETYCSLQALLNPTESLEAFIYHLRSDESLYRERWYNYLSYLARAIDNLHMVIDYDVIIGGTLGQYLTSEDIHFLHEFIIKNSAFPSQRKFIHISHTASIPNAKGAAIPFIKDFMDKIL